MKQTNGEINKLEWRIRAETKWDGLGRILARIRAVPRSEQYGSRSDGERKRAQSYGMGMTKSF